MPETHFLTKVSDKKKMRLSLNFSWFLNNLRWVGAVLVIDGTGNRIPKKTVMTEIKKTEMTRMTNMTTSF